MNAIETTNKKDIIRAVLSLALGVSVVLWRVVLPTSVEITLAVGISIMILDIVLAVTLILINKKELKKTFIQRKFTKKEFLIILIGFVLFFASNIVTGIAVNALDRLGVVTYIPPLLTTVVEPGYVGVLPIGVFVSIVICAPVWEEIAFRMAGRTLFKNNILYVVIPTWLFGFIHTADLFAVCNVNYFVAGAFLAILYLITKNIRITMAVHFMVNLLGLSMMIINSLL